MAAPRKKPEKDETEAPEAAQPEPKPDPGPEPAQTEVIKTGDGEIDLDDPATWPEAEDAPEPEPAPAPTPAFRPPPPPPRADRNDRTIRPFNFPKPPSRLQFGRLIAANHKWRTLAADIPAGTEAEDILDPAYWAHHVDSIEPNDMIVAVCEDGTWEGWFRVTAKFQAEIHLSPLFVARHEAATSEPISDQYDVEWISAPKRWGVVRVEDKMLIQADFQTKSQAYNWLKTHLANQRR